MMDTTSITDRVLAYYKEQILSGAWQVGEKIPSEHQLTELLGVSRASVRTATRQLLGLGVLESYQGRGTYLIDDRLDRSAGDTITAQDCKDAQKALEFRRIIEPEACYLAAQYADDELIQKLSGYMEQMTLHTKEEDLFISADVAFHQCICEGTGNPLLAKSMARVLWETKINQHTTYTIEDLTQSVCFHRAIFNAIKSHDGDLAREIMRQHLQHAWDLLQSRLNTGKSS